MVGGIINGDGNPVCHDKIMETLIIFIPI